MKSRKKDRRRMVNIISSLKFLTMKFTWISPAFCLSFCSMDYSFFCVVTCGSSYSFNSRMSAESFSTKKLMQCKYELKFLIMNKVGTALFMKNSLHIYILFNRPSNKPRLQMSKTRISLNWVFTLQKRIKCWFKIHTVDKEYTNIRKNISLTTFK